MLKLYISFRLSKQFACRHILKLVWKQTISTRLLVLQFWYLCGILKSINFGFGCDKVSNCWLNSIFGSGSSFCDLFSLGYYFFRPWNQLSIVNFELFCIVLGSKLLSPTVDHVSYWECLYLFRFRTIYNFTPISKSIFIPNVKLFLDSRVEFSYLVQSNLSIVVLPPTSLSTLCTVRRGGLRKFVKLYKKWCRGRASDRHSIENDMPKGGKSEALGIGMGYLISYVFGNPCLAHWL